MLTALKYKYHIYNIYKFLFVLFHYVQEEFFLEGRHNAIRDHNFYNKSRSFLNHY